MRILLLNTAMPGTINSGASPLVHHGIVVIIIFIYLYLFKKDWHYYS